MKGAGVLKEVLPQEGTKYGSWKTLHKEVA